MTRSPAVKPSRSFPVILAAPSGAGKTTIAQRLRERREDTAFSISATTRPPRSYEVDGKDYHFVSDAEFQRMIAEGELLEWAEVHGHLYGTPRRNLVESVERDSFLILDIDVQGARQVRRMVPEAVGIFILPPSGRALVERLARRASEEQAVRARRLVNARRELGAVHEFDYLVVNDDVERSVSAIEAIIAAESSRVCRIPALDETVARIRAEVDEFLRPQTPPNGVSPLDL